MVSDFTLIDFVITTERLAGAPGDHDERQAIKANLRL
jgi:hypothetical protein